MFHRCLNILNHDHFYRLLERQPSVVAVARKLLNDYSFIRIADGVQLISRLIVQFSQLILGLFDLLLMSRLDMKHTPWKDWVLLLFIIPVGHLYLRRLLDPCARVDLITVRRRFTDLHRPRQRRLALLTFGDEVRISQLLTFVHHKRYRLPPLSGLVEVDSCRPGRQHGDLVSSAGHQI